MKLKPSSDVREILLKSQESINRLSGQHILILGGTGFVGGWILEALSAANRNHAGINVKVVTRDKERAERTFQNSNFFGIQFLQWDENLIFDSRIPRPEYIIFGATPSTYSQGAADPRILREVTESSMQYVCSLLSNNSDVKSVINLSSGAVYGTNHDPNFKFDIDRLEVGQREVTTYGQLKIDSELKLSNACRNSQVRFTNARLFAFFGPGIPLDEHFAIGNFIGAALQGKPIMVSGNPGTTRSYMYPTDLISIILNLLVVPLNRPVNVGSTIPITIKNLAEKISSKYGISESIVLENENLSTHYVPAISALEKGVVPENQVTLDEGLERWVRWLS